MEAQALHGTNPAEWGSETKSWEAKALKSPAHPASLPHDRSESLCSVLCAETEIPASKLTSPGISRLLNLRPGWERNHPHEACLQAEITAVGSGQKLDPLQLPPRT